MEFRWLEPLRVAQVVRLAEDSGSGAEKAGELIEFLRSPWTSTKSAQIAKMKDNYKKLIVGESISSRLRH